MLVRFPTNFSTILIGVFLQASFPLLCFFNSTLHDASEVPLFFSFLNRPRGELGRWIDGARSHLRSNRRGLPRCTHVHCVSRDPISSLLEAYVFFHLKDRASYLTSIYFWELLDKEKCNCKRCHRRHSSRS